MVPGSRSTSTARGTYLCAVQTEDVLRSGTQTLRGSCKTQDPLGPPVREHNVVRSGSLNRPGISVLTGSLVVVDVDPVQLQSRVAHVAPRGVDAVLIADHLPELGQERGGVSGAFTDSSDFLTEPSTQTNKSQMFCSKW